MRGAGHFLIFSTISSPTSRERGTENVTTSSVKKCSLQIHTVYTSHALHRKYERSSSSPLTRRQMYASLFFLYVQS